MKLIRFTEPDGSDVWLCPAWIIRVSTPIDAAKARGHVTRIHLSDGIQDVTETADVVVTQLRSTE
jgi:hypothetical protein